MFRRSTTVQVILMASRFIVLVLRTINRNEREYANIQVTLVLMVERRGCRILTKGRDFARGEGGQKIPKIKLTLYVHGPLGSR